MTSRSDRNRVSPLRHIVHATLALAVLFQTFSPEWMSKPWRTGTPSGRLVFELHQWGGLIAGVSALLVAFGLWVAHRRGSVTRVDRAAVLAQSRLLLSGLLSLHMPPASATRALARAVQLLGLLLVAWFSVTGAAIWWVGAASETAHRIGSLHELAAPLLYLYLGGHVGMAVLHRLGGHSAEGAVQARPVH